MDSSHYERDVAKFHIQHYASLKQSDLCILYGYFKYTGPQKFLQAEQHQMIHWIEVRLILVRKLNCKNDLRFMTYFLKGVLKHHQN